MTDSELQAEFYKKQGEELKNRVLLGAAAGAAAGAATSVPLARAMQRPNSYVLRRKEEKEQAELGK